MRFSCTKENFSKALSLVAGLTGKNINLPILNNILIKADEQKVELVATNLEVAAKAILRAKVDAPGQFTVPARTIAEYVALLPDDKISVELKENELILAVGNSTTKIKGSPADEYPIVPEIGGGAGYSVDAAILSSALSQVLPAVAKNEIRPELAGVLFNFKAAGKELVLAATDSYRLAEKTITIDSGDKDARVIVPFRAAQEITRVLSVAEEDDGEKKARLLVGDNQLSLSFSTARLTTRLTEGNYPDYTQIIPQQFKTTATVDVARFVKEIRAAGLFTTNGVNAVSVTVSPEEGKIQISSTSQQTGEHNTSWPVEAKGEKITLVLNHRYLLDGLNSLGSKDVELKEVVPESACVMAPKGDGSFVYIIMPIRQ